MQDEAVRWKSRSNIITWNLATVVTVVGARHIPGSWFFGELSTQVFPPRPSTAPNFSPILPGLWLLLQSWLMLYGCSDAHPGQRRYVRRFDGIATRLLHEAARWSKNQGKTVNSSRFVQLHKTLNHWFSATRRVYSLSASWLELCVALQKYGFKAP